MVPNNPINTLYEVTLDTVYNPPLRGLYVGTSGDVAITTASGEVVLPDLAAGVFHPIIFSKIATSGTEATGIFGGR